jgi:hypothetical protein
MKPLPDHLPPRFFLRDGNTCNLHKPDKAVFANLDVGLTLATLNRWGGNTRQRYSVAEHSLLVAALVPDHLRQAALVHDAGEAITGDLCRPLRAAFPALDDLCDEWQDAANKFYAVNHVTALDLLRLKVADDAATAIEARDLLGQKPDQIRLAELPDITNFPDMHELFGLSDNTNVWARLWHRCLCNDNNESTLQQYLDFVDAQSLWNPVRHPPIITRIEDIRQKLDQAFDRHVKSCEDQPYVQIGENVVWFV